jgi:hypothetical protein
MSALLLIGVAASMIGFAFLASEINKHMDR